MVQLRFKPAYPAQEAFFNTHATFSMLSGGIGSGKSYPMCFKVLVRCVKYPGERALIVRKNQSSLQQSTWQTLMRVVPKALIVADKSSEHKMQLTIRTLIPGVYSTINCSGLDKKAGEEYPQKIGSTEYGTIAIDEGGETDKGDFAMLAGRLRHKPEPANDPQYAKLYEDYNNQMFTATNPEGPHHHLYDFFIQNKPPANPGERAFWMSTPYDNRHNLRSGYIEMLESTLTGVMRERLLMGQWTMATGLVYKEYLYSKHVADVDFLRDDKGAIDYGAYKDIIGGADSNFPKPRAVVLIGVRGDGKIDVLDEFYKERAHVEDALEWLEGKAEQYGRTITVYQDPSDPPAVDKYNQGKGLIAFKAFNKVAPGISNVARHFANDTIRLHPNCVNLARELASYRYQPGKDNEPVKENDHACDALRYAIASYEQGDEDFFFLEDTEGLVM